MTLTPSPEGLTIFPGLARGAEVVGGTRTALGGLAQSVSHNTAASAASLLGTAAALGGSLLTGAFLWKGIDIMVRGPKALPSIIHPSNA